MKDGLLGPKAPNTSYILLQVSQQPNKKIKPRNAPTVTSDLPSFPKIFRNAASLTSIQVTTTACINKEKGNTIEIKHE